MNSRQHSFALLSAAAALLPMCAQAAPTCIVKTPPPCSDHWTDSIKVIGILNKQGKLLKANDTINLAVGITYVIAVTTCTGGGNTRDIVKEHPIELTFFTPILHRNLRSDRMRRESFVVLRQTSPENPRVSVYRTDYERSFKEFKVRFIAAPRHGTVAQGSRQYEDTDNPNFQALFRTYRVFDARSTVKMRMRG